VRWGEMAISAGMAVMAAMFYVLATFTQNINPVDPGPAFYPRIVSLLLFVAALVQVVCAWREGRARSGGSRGVGGTRASGGSRYVLSTLALSVVYVALFDKIPYLIGASVFLLALMVLGGVRRWFVLCGAALGYALTTYYIFGTVLMVPLP
jgi:putative tricarboxylic transport membrane protein